MNNPFIFGRTVSGENFINRTKEIEQLTRTLTSGQNVIIYSPRRYGKTSLIKMVMKELEKNKIAVFYLDLYRISSLEEFYTAYSKLILPKIKSSAQKIFSQLNMLLPSLSPKLVYKSPDSPSIEISVQIPVLKKSETLAELFNSIDTLLKNRKKRGCVIIDEFQEIMEIENGKMLEREMRSSFQHHENLAYVFLGSKYHLMQTLFKDRNRPFYNFGKHFPIDVIKKATWSAYIAKQFTKGGFTLTGELCDQIVDVTNGHPYYTQLFCSELWDLHWKKKALDKDSIANTIESVLSKETRVFEGIWDTLKARDRRIIKAIAQEGFVMIYSKEFISNYNFGSPSAIQRNIEKLSKKNLIIRNENNVYTLGDPIFELWLKNEK